MNGIDPKWVFYLGIIVTIESAIGQGAVKLTNVVPDSWAPFIIGWCTLLAFIGNVVMTALAGYSSKTAGPLVKPVVLLAVILGALFAFTGDARAQGKLTGNLVKDIAAATTANKPVASSGSLPSNILGALDDKLLPDLQYALKLAQASDSKVTAPCYQAWINIIQTRQKAVTNADGSPVDLPQPRLITDFEKAVELRNALQPESAFSIACAPVIVMVKLDILSFMGKVIGGGAGLATLVPGL